MNKNKTTRDISQDRSKVANGQDHEVTYERNKMNVSAQKLKEVVSSAGNSRKEVKKKLKG